MPNRKVRVVEVSVDGTTLSDSVQFLPKEIRMAVVPVSGGVLEAEEMAGPAVFYLRQPVGADADLDELFGRSGRSVKVEHFLVEINQQGSEVSRTRLREIDYKDVVFSGYLADDGESRAVLRGETAQMPVITPVVDAPAAN